MRCVSQILSVKQQISQQVPMSRRHLPPTEGEEHGGWGIVTEITYIERLNPV